jgi:hypothetical protein
MARLSGDQTFALALLEGIREKWMAYNAKDLAAMSSRSIYGVWVAMHAQTGPLIRVHPATALIDVCRSIQLHGFLPAQPVEVAATLREHDGRVWRSCATFLTDGK